MNSIKNLILIILFALFIPIGLFSQNPEYDKYGGRSDLNIDKGTGFFRLGKIGDKHFLVTPEGNAFKAIGINHTHMNKNTNYDQIIENLKALGFNSGDYQGPQWMWDRFPYTKGVNLLATSTWLSTDKFKFEDVFSEQFLTSLENKVKSIVVPMANKKMLIAYFLTDMPVWYAKKDGKGWIDFYNALDENAVGKIEFEKWKEANPDSPDEDFIPIIARQVYSKGIEFIRKYDKNHLIFSDRYGEWNFSDKVAAEVLPFVDGIAVQPKNYLTMSFFQSIYEKFKKPVFLADHVTSYATSEYSNTMGQVAKNHTDYLEYYRKSVNDVLSLPYMVGYNKCQYMDEVKGTQLKQGLYRSNGEPYEYVSELTEVHKSALKNAYSVPEYSMSQQLQDWGIYEDAKQKAIQRIIKHRMGVVQLKVILPNGQELKNSEVKVKLKRHDFKWGAVIRESFFTSPYSGIYKQNFLKYFNSTGFGLELKPKWRYSDYEKTVADIGMPWLLENDIYVRGHALAWEGYNYMRPEDKAIADDATLTDQKKGEQLLASCSKHFYHAIPKWDVNCWDVTNEPIGNNLINDLLPNMDTHVYWFKLADSLRQVHDKKDLALYENDYQIISAITPWALNAKKDGFKSVGRPAIYRELIDNHIAEGAKVDGIGFQSRLKNGLITPDTIYKRLCDFERFNLPFQATEFEIRDNQDKYIYTDAERSLLTEFMMVMYFSHPNVNGFWHWTFFDVENNVDWDYSLFNYDGTPKINGQIWMDLMDGFFDTELGSYTNSSGETELKGYYGEYEISTEINSDTLTATFAIDSTNTEQIITVYLKGNMSTSNHQIKKKTNKIRISQGQNKEVFVTVDAELLRNKILEVEFYDLQGRKFYKKQLVESISTIKMDVLGEKGFSIITVKDLKSGIRMAVGKVILM